MDKCPNCGYCSHCGRSNWPNGYWPSTWPYRPTWVVSTPTTAPGTLSGGTIPNPTPTWSAPSYAGESSIVQQGYSYTTALSGTVC